MREARVSLLFLSIAFVSKTEACEGRMSLAMVSMRCHFIFGSSNSSGAEKCHEHFAWQLIED